MKTTSLETIAPLLTQLRAHPSLHEIRPTEFQVNGRDFLHFHDGDHGVFADVLLANGRIHMPVSSPGEQGALMDRIEEVLESLELHHKKRFKRERRDPAR